MTKVAKNRLLKKQMSPRCTKSLFSCMSGVAESKNPRSHKELLGFVLF